MPERAASTNLAFLTDQVANGSRILFAYSPGLRSKVPQQLRPLAEHGVDIRISGVQSSFAQSCDVIVMNEMFRRHLECPMILGDLLRQVSVPVVMEILDGKERCTHRIVS